MEVKELELLRKYIDGKVSEINDTWAVPEGSQAAGFPFETVFVNGFLVTDTAQQIDELAPAQHYLIYYRTYDNVAFELHEGQGDDTPSAGEINIMLLGEEIDLYYRPYDFDVLDPQTPVKIFGTGMYVTPDENNPGSLTVSPPSEGETGICLVFRLSPTPHTTELTALYYEEGSIDDEDDNQGQNLG